MSSKRIRSKVAILLAICLFLILLLSERYIITHLHHHCTGAECPVCAEIHMAEAVLQQIGSALLMGLIFVFFAWIIEKSILMHYQVIVVTTPVKWKVRMND